MNPHSDEQTHSERIRRAQGGDLGALGPVIAQLHPLLVAQARGRLGPHLSSRIDPEDLVNSAWDTVFQHLPRLEARKGRLTPVLVRFLGTAIVNAANNVARRVAKELTAGSDFDAAAATSRHEGLVEGAAETVSGLLGTLARSEEAEAVRRELELLDEEARHLVILRSVESAPWAYVGEVLGISENAARQRHQRILARLRDRLRGTVLSELHDD